MQPLLTPELLLAGELACRQVSDDFMQGVRDYRDSYGQLTSDGMRADVAAVLCDEIDGARHWRRMSARFARLRKELERDRS